MSIKKQNKKVNTRRAILFRAYLVFGLAACFGLWVLVSAARLQLGYDKEFSKLLKEKNTMVEKITAIRGNIYSDDESLLATTVPLYDLMLDPLTEGLTDKLFNAKIDSLSLLFSQHFPTKDREGWKNYFAALRKKNGREVKVQKELGFDQVKMMKRWPIIRNGTYKGFFFKEKGKRLYFLGDLAKRSIGYSKEGVYVGLEGAFDSLLRGRDGKRTLQKMPGNTWRPIKVANNEDAINGYDIVTTLDVNVQDVAQDALNRTLTENEADHGCAIVMEVSTGAIKAIANLKRGKDGKYYESQNYAVDDYSEPGSTFKLISAMALLEDGHVAASDSINVGNGETSFYGLKMKDAHAPSKSILTLQESFEHSSNVGISKFVQKYYGQSPAKFTRHAIDLGLNMRPDFDIRSPGAPLMKTPSAKDWSATSLPWMSIGYEMKISPMQTLMVYNAIANNGRMLAPYFVQEIRLEGRTIQKMEPRVLKEAVCSPSTVAALKKMMEGVVDHGTATNLKNKSYTVAGKTGTAQISQGKSGYDHSSYKASFVGYFPAENPQYTVIVVINEPRKGAYYGSSVAGPVFKQIADKIYSSSHRVTSSLPGVSSLQIPQVLNGNAAKTRAVLNFIGVTSQNDSSGYAPWIIAQPARYHMNLKPINTAANKLPNTVGMGLRDAIQLLESRKIKVTYTGFGRVTAQSLPAGSPVVQNMTVHLTLSPF